MAKKKQKKQNNGNGQKFLSEEQYVRQRVRSLEIGTCYVSDDIFEYGEGTVIVTRKHTGGRISAAFYLTDVWCTGVKGSFYRLRMEDFELEEAVETFNASPCSYEEVHNLVYGAEAFAFEAGIEPCKDFAMAKYFLEEDTEEIPLVEYEFGQDGKHFLMASSKLEASKYLPSLRENLGENGFEVVIEGEEDMDENSDLQYSPVTMDELLQDFSRETLVRLAFLLGFTLDESQSDDEMRKQYRDEVLANIEQMIASLSLGDYVVLLEFKNGYYPGKSVYVGENHQALMMELFGMVDIDYDDRGYKVLYLATDFAEIILPLINSEVCSEYYDVRLIEQDVSGLANLYGEVSLKEVLEYMRKLDDEYEYDAHEKFKSAYALSPLLKMMYYYDNKIKLPEEEDKLENRIFFISRVGWSDLDKMHEMLRRTDARISSRKEFTDAEISDIGTIIQPRIPNKVRNDFARYLTSLGFVKPEIHTLCFNLWFFAMHESDPGGPIVSPQVYFKRKVKEAVELEEIEDFSMEEALKHLEEYLEHIPRWTLKGYSSYEFKSL